MLGASGLFPDEADEVNLEVTLGVDERALVKLLI